MNQSHEGIMPKSHIKTTNNNNNNRNSYLAIKKGNSRYLAIKLQQIGTRVEEWILSECREEAVLRYGTIRQIPGQKSSGYQKVVQEALVEGLRVIRNKQQQTTKSTSLGKEKYRGDVIVRLEEIQKILNDAGDHEWNRFTLKQINMAISTATNHADSRTLLKYRKIVINGCDEISTSCWNLSPFLNRVFRARTKPKVRSKQVSDFF